MLGIDNTLTKITRRVEQSDLATLIVRAIKDMLQERLTRIAFMGLLFLIFMGLFGPMLAPYEYDHQQYDGGELERLEKPSLDHPLGTTQGGYDVLSRVLYGSRYTLLTGAVAGSIMLTIGVFIGVTAGYLGGRTDSLLMRFTDFMYGIPFIPFGIVLVTFFGAGFYTTVAVIGLILWRFIARVLRSQVLQIKQRPYIMEAQVSGASAPWIIRKHILPNIANMAALFFALGVGIAILGQAGLAFIGVTSPFLPSWGIMIRNANVTGNVVRAWWWSYPPGIMISISVLSLYLLGRGYEQASNEQETVVTT